VPHAVAHAVRACQPVGPWLAMQQALKPFHFSSCRYTVFVAKPHSFKSAIVTDNCWLVFVLAATTTLSNMFPSTKHFLLLYAGSPNWHWTMISLATLLVTLPVKSVTVNLMIATLLLITFKDISFWYYFFRITDSLPSAYKALPVAHINRLLLLSLFYSRFKCVLRSVKWQWLWLDLETSDGQH